MQPPTYGPVSTGGRRAPVIGGRTHTLADASTARLTRLRLLKLALLLSVLGLAFQGVRGIWDPDEGRYVAIAMNMLKADDYVIPRLNPDHSHFAKPPLAYWAIAMSLATFGQTEFAARLPGALAFTMTGFTLAMLAVTARLRRPLLAALIWATTLLPFLAGSVMTPDMLLTFFETLAVLGYLRWRFDASRYGILLMWISFGAAFMTKGPPALLPLLAILAFQFRYRHQAPVLAMFRFIPVICFVLIAFSWTAFVLARDTSLWHYFLVNETFDRIATDVHGRNPGWMGLIQVFGPTILIGTLPFGPLLLWYLSRRNRAAASDQPDERRNAFRLFLYLWLALPFAVFAVSQSRLPLYLAPLTVPFALLTARTFEECAAPSLVIRNLALASAAALLLLRLSSAEWDTAQDSRALAVALRSKADVSQYEEILFVDGRRAANGLEFYTGKPIEATHTKGTPRPGEHSEPLCDKLRRSSDPLLLVPAGQSAHYADRAGRCMGRSFVPLGRVREYDLLSLEQRAEIAPVSTDARQWKHLE